MRIRKTSPAFLMIAMVLVSLAAVTGVQAAGLHTDVALSPPEGGTIIRAQWRYSELSNDQSAPDHRVKLNINSITVVHGVTSNFTVLGSVPLIQRESDFGTEESVDDSGLNRDDVLRGDFAVSRRLYADEFEALGPVGLYAIGEINANYMTDGSTQVFGSPGLQLITPRSIVSKEFRGIPGLVLN